MTIPENTQVYETPISFHWIDNNGIVCSLPKKAERKLSHYVLTMELYASLMKDGKKNCLLTLTENSGTMDKEIRDYLSAELPKYFKAMAVISKRPLQATLANLFLKFSWKRFPIKLFSKEKDAVEWLKKFL